MTVGGGPIGDSGCAALRERGLADGAGILVGAGKRGESLLVCFKGMGEGVGILLLLRWFEAAEFGETMSERAETSDLFDFAEDGSGDLGETRLSLFLLVLGLFLERKEE